MKKSSLTILCAAFLSAIAYSCTGSDGGTTSEKHGSRSSDTTDTAGIRSVALDISVKTARRYYSVTELGDPCSLTVSMAVDWPETIGDYDIARLQQTILSEITPEGETSSSVTKSIARFVSDTGRFGLGDSISRMDKAPKASPTAYEVSTDVKFMALENDIVTFNVTNYSYLGGAHGMYTEAPFSFDLAQGKVIDLKWLFTGGYESELIPLLEEGVAAKANMTTRMLGESMLASAFPIASSVYIHGGLLVFHYNPYEVLPYSYGSIDVSISPYMLRDVLTPQAQQALL